MEYVRHNGICQTQPTAIHVNRKLCMNEATAGEILYILFDEILSKLQSLQVWSIFVCLFSFLSYRMVCRVCCFIIILSMSIQHCGCKGYKILSYLDTQECCVKFGITTRRYSINLKFATIEGYRPIYKHELDTELTTIYV